EWPGDVGQLPRRNPRRPPGRCRDRHRGRAHHRRRAVRDRLYHGWRDDRPRRADGAPGLHRSAYPWRRRRRRARGRGRRARRRPAALGRDRLPADPRGRRGGAHDRRAAGDRAGAGGARGGGRAGRRDRPRRAPGRSLPQPGACRRDRARAPAPRRAGPGRAPARRVAGPGPADDCRTRCRRRARPDPRAGGTGDGRQPGTYRRRLRSLPARPRRRGATHDPPLQRDDRPAPSGTRRGRRGAGRRSRDGRAHRRRRARPPGDAGAGDPRQGGCAGCARQRRSRAGGAAAGRVPVVRPRHRLRRRDGASAGRHPGRQS
ncbi:MAG: N-acetylglucosamine-6-phosphate deacetylase, partial [uncultured Thermomicrobiales bacterium]